MHQFKLLQSTAPDPEAYIIKFPNDLAEFQKQCPATDSRAFGSSPPKPRIDESFLREVEHSIPMRCTRGVSCKFQRPQLFGQSVQAASASLPPGPLAECVQQMFCMQQQTLRAMQMLAMQRAPALVQPPPVGPVTPTIPLAIAAAVPPSSPPAPPVALAIPGAAANPVVLAAAPSTPATSHEGLCTRASMELLASSATPCVDPTPSPATPESATSEPLMGMPCKRPIDEVAGCLTQAVSKRQVMKRPASKTHPRRPPAAMAGPVRYMQGTVYVNAAKEMYRVKKYPGDRLDVKFHWNGDVESAWAKALAIIEEAAA